MHVGKTGVGGSLSTGYAVKARAVMLVITALIVVACVMFLNSYSQQLFQQRAYNLGQTMEKVAQLVNNAIDNEWDRLNYLSHELNLNPPVDANDLMRYLSAVYRIDGHDHAWQLSCIDSQGGIYRWDGTSGRWNIPDMLIDDRPNRQALIMESAENDAELLLLLFRLPSPIVLGDESLTVTHTMLTIDIATFRELLEVSAYNDSSYIYITEKNGLRLYHQTNQSEFTTAYNILSALGNYSYIFDVDYEDITGAVSRGTPVTTLFEREDGRYFVSYAPVSTNDWSLFLFVPESSVGGNTANFALSLMVEFSAIAALVIALVVFFVWTNARQTVARQ
ncbi:MAG: hypothetical protein Q4D04_13680, partial [Clostridia bacterium]|nr:hypothetical protein [Clostridia bacterium]